VANGKLQRSESQFRFACELVRNGRIGKVRTVEVGLPGGLSDFDGLGGQDSPVPPPKTLDYDRWLGPAPYAPYCPRASTRRGAGTWITAAAC